MSKDKPPSKAAAKALADLEALEAAAVEADQAAREASLALTKARAEHEDLDRRRWKLLRDRPELQDRDGAPVDDTNDLAKLEQERAKVGNPHDLQRECDHRRTIQNRCDERVREYRADHVAELVEGFTPRAEEATRQLADALDAARAAAEHYRGCWNRSAGLVGPVDGLTTRCVPGADEIGAVEKTLAQVGGALPVPVPDLTPPQAVVVFPDDRPGGADE